MNRRSLLKAIAAAPAAVLAWTRVKPPACAHLFVHPHRLTGYGILIEHHCIKCGATQPTTHVLLGGGGGGGRDDSAASDGGYPVIIGNGTGAASDT